MLSCKGRWKAHTLIGKILLRQSTLSDIRWPRWKASSLIPLSGKLLWKSKSTIWLVGRRFLGQVISLDCGLTLLMGISLYMSSFQSFLSFATFKISLLTSGIVSMSMISLGGVWTLSWPPNGGELCSFVDRLNTSSDPDRVVWAMGPKKLFTTKSMYEFLEGNIAGCDFKWIWRAKIPSKIQIFLWQLFQDAVLTGDVMSRRNWAGNPRCSFCSERETSQYLFLCPEARVVWRTVGSVFGTDLCHSNVWQ